MWSLIRTLETILKARYQTSLRQFHAFWRSARSGKVKEAIRSYVNLPVGQRYSEACRTLRVDFGQPHMIVEAHMKKLREVQVRKADASTFMEFARRLEDARRVLAGMGHDYTSRLDNEDVIIAMMRKLPDESLKRKWADESGDLIKRKG